MMDCTKLFFSNQMCEHARTLLINARSSDIDGPSLLKSIKEEDGCEDRDRCYETVQNSCSSSSSSSNSKFQQIMHALTAKMMEKNRSVNGCKEIKWSEFEKMLATVTAQMREESTLGLSSSFSTAVSVGQKRRRISPPAV